MGADVDAGLDVVNVLFGPPLHSGDVADMLGLFFSSGGIHIVCGGTTAQLVADFLHKPLEIDLRYPVSGLPPVGCIDGVDLVTEGVVTMTKVLELSKDALGGRLDVSSKDDDGASIVWNHLSNALEVNLFVGCAENSCNPSCGIAVGYRPVLAKELASVLSRLGKKVVARYF